LGFDVGVAHVQANWGPIFGAGLLISPMQFNGQIGPTSVGTGKNKPELHFAYGFVVANGWLVQTPRMNGYSGGFGYNQASAVTIVAEAAKSEIANTDGAPSHSPRGRHGRDPGITD
jgi:hypothetical protein